MPWKATLWQILPKLADLFFRWFKRRERKADYEKRQAKRDAAAENPRDAFDKHFNGRVPADGEDQPAASSKTRKAGDSN